MSSKLIVETISSIRVLRDAGKIKGDMESFQWLAHSPLRPRRTSVLIVGDFGDGLPSVRLVDRLTQLL